MTTARLPDHDPDPLEAAAGAFDDLSISLEELLGIIDGAEFDALPEPELAAKPPLKKCGISEAPPTIGATAGRFQTLEVDDEEEVDGETEDD